MDQPAANPSDNPAPAEVSHKILKERRYRKVKGKTLRRVPMGAPRTTKFVKSTNALKDHNYDLCYNMSDQYIKTTKAIFEYVGSEYKNGAEIK